MAKSENYVAESYGVPLPVLVNEALTFSDRVSAVSINCSPSGWAWVCEYTLFGIDFVCVNNKGHFGRRFVVAVCSFGNIKIRQRRQNRTYEHHNDGRQQL